MKFKLSSGKIIFLIGPPASGKDTQGKILAKKLKGEFVVTSDLLRKFFKKAKKGYLKINQKLIDLKKEKEKLKTGDLVDSDLVIYVILEKLKEAIDEKKTLVISGSPRRLWEAKKEFYFLNSNLKDGFIFVLLEVPKKEILKRCLKRKREDDTLEIVERRIENYKKDTLPAIDFLKNKGVLIRVNGKGEVLQIHRQILKKIFQYFKYQ